MTVLHLSLLAGLAVITVPIMLHLFGQRQPQLIDFPALRFIRETRQEQSSSWQLRHFLLLLLRILLLAALALALAQPRVHSALLGSVIGAGSLALLAALASLIAAVAYVSKRPLGIWLTCAAIAIALWAAAGTWAVRSFSSGPSVPGSDSSSPIAAAIIIDNGPSMTYKSENETRLEAAQSMVKWILDQLPIDSRVGILSGAPVGALALDPATAKTQVEIVEPRSAHVDLLSRLRTAVDLVLANELERKEVYVVTDLMAASWSASQPDLIKLLEEHQDEVLVQIIDVGEPATSNWTLGDVESDFNTVASGGNISFNIRVQHSDSSASVKANSVSVELIQEAIDPRLPIITGNQLQTPPAQVVDRQVLDLKNNSTATVELRARDLQAGSHHFTIQLDQNDPLMIDNRRFATIVARDQQPTLIVANDAYLARQLRLLVDLSGARAEDGSQLVQDVRFTQLPQVELSKFSVICLLDPPSLSPKLAQSLKEHVLGGGGLLLLLGPGLGSVEQVKGNAIETLLPGTLSEMLQRPSTQRSSFLSPTAITHPVFREIASIEGDVPWFLFPIFKSWNFDNMSEGALVLAALSDGSSPLLVAHELGRGQILTLTTPVPEVEERGRGLWNELWVGTDPWPAYGLLLGCFHALSGVNEASYNFYAGEPVSLVNDPFTWPKRYELFRPNAQSGGVDANDGILSLGQFEQAGIYRMRGQMGSTPISRGFSINVPSGDTLLQRLEASQLDQQLGEVNYRIARSRDEVESSVGQARFGRELYPLLMLLVAALFLAEQAMSNRFYRLKFSRGGRPEKTLLAPNPSGGR